MTSSPGRPPPRRARAPRRLPPLLVALAGGAVAACAPIAEHASARPGHHARRRTARLAPRLLRDGASDRIAIHPTQSTTEIIARPIAQRMAVCDRPTPDTPLSTFDVFATTIAEQYPFFAQHGVDWGRVVSAVMGRRLPNGWVAGVPSERFVTRGKSYDVIGIPPTIMVPLFTPADLAARRDTALEMALRRARGE